MILGHAACTYVINKAFFRSNLNAPFLLITTYLPDIFDKTLSVLFHTPPRGYFHSLFIMLSIYAFFKIIFTKSTSLNSLYLNGGLLLYFLHIIGDLPEANVLLWPFDGPISFVVNFNALEVIYNFYILRTSPFQLLLEVIFVALAIAMKTIENRSSIISSSKNYPCKN